MFLERAGKDVYDFRWSPDGRWISFAPDSGPWQRRLYVAPFAGDQGPSENAWIPITDDSAFENDPSWSPNGNWIYSLSNRDGFDCICAYPLEPETKRPAGAPVGIFTLMCYAYRRATSFEGHELTVARDRIVFNQGEMTGNIWMTTLPVN